MMEIWKYPLKIERIQKLEMPEGAKALSVELQEGNPCLWALVDPEEKPVPRYVVIIGTGHKITHQTLNDTDFVGTVVLRDATVWHVFIESQQD